jgi:hypothetical protein
MPDNIRYFPNLKIKKSSQARKEWGIRWIAALIPLFLGFLLRTPSAGYGNMMLAGDLNLPLLMLIGYWCFARGIHNKLIHIGFGIILAITALPYLGAMGHITDPLAGFWSRTSFLDFAFYVGLLGMAAMWFQAQKQAPAYAYFLRYHYLMAAVLFFFLVLGFALLVSLSDTLMAFLNLIGLGGIQITSWAQIIIQFGVVAFVSFLLAFSALRGKTPRIPFASDIIRQWI